MGEVKTYMDDFDGKPIARNATKVKTTVTVGNKVWDLTFRSSENRDAFEKKLSDLLKYTTPTKAKATEKKEGAKRTAKQSEDELKFLALAAVKKLGDAEAGRRLKAWWNLQPVAEKEVFTLQGRTSALMFSEFLKANVPASDSFYTDDNYVDAAKEQFTPTKASAPDAKPS